MAPRITNRFVAQKWMGFYISLTKAHDVSHSEGTFSHVIFRMN